ncbi:cornichon homolog 1 isoform X1 [Tanacetum coccineum]
MSTKFIMHLNLRSDRKPRVLSNVISQIVCLSDLENDLMNPYESSSRINSVVLPEMVLHCAGSALLLLTGFWFLFLLTLPITIYSSMKYMNKQHLIDVTEVFRYLDAEKKYRIAKLVLYAFVFLLVIIRSAVAGKFSAILEPFYPTSEDLDIRSHVLEF